MERFGLRVALALISGQGKLACPFRSVPIMKIPIILKKLSVHLRHFFAIHTLFKSFFQTFLSKIDFI